MGKQLPLLRLTATAFFITYICLSIVGNLFFAGVLSGLDNSCGQHHCSLSALFYHTWMTCAVHADRLRHHVVEKLGALVHRCLCSPCRECKHIGWLDRVPKCIHYCTVQAESVTTSAV